MSVVENDQVPDPRDIAQILNAVKEHTVLIYNTDGLTGDLAKIPFPDLTVKMNENEPVEIRIHSLCRFGDALFSQSCDCGPQLLRGHAYDHGAAAVIFYLDQEGRNAGLTAKTAANNCYRAGGWN